LAVIVVCYHSGAVVQACVDALDAAVEALPASTRPDVELVLVANSADDATIEVASRECRVIRLRAPGNVGFAPAVNLALAIVPEATFVLLLNPDAQLARDCLGVLLSEATSRQAALVGPIFCDASGQPDGVSERPFHSVRRECATQLLGAARLRRAYGQEAYETGTARCLSGACLLVDGRFLRAVGGLDYEVRMYLEDVLLCWQAHQLGRQVVLAREARCVHALGASSAGTNFGSSLDLHLTLLGARVVFVTRASGPAHAVALRVLMGVGAAIRVVVATGHSRKTHMSVVRWAITSGRPPRWNDGPIVEVR